MLETDPVALQSISTPILGIFAENDQGIPPSSVHAFEEGLVAIDIESDITIYPWVDHAFANPTGGNYSPDETKDAWNKTLSFLSKYLGE